MDLRKGRPYGWWFLDSLLLENPLHYARRPWRLKNFPWSSVDDFFKEGVPFMPLYEFDDHEVGLFRGPNDAVASKYLPFVLYDERMRQNAALKRKELGLGSRVWGMEYGLPYEDSKGHIRPMPKIWSDKVYKSLFQGKLPLVGAGVEQEKLIYYFQMLIAGGFEQFQRGFEKVDLHGTREDLLEFAVTIGEYDTRLNEQFLHKEDFSEFNRSPLRDQLVNLAHQMNAEDVYLARRMRRAIKWEFVGYLRSYRKQNAVTAFGRFSFLF
jgi:hypothetical protein